LIVIENRHPLVSTFIQFVVICRYFFGRRQPPAFTFSLAFVLVKVYFVVRKFFHPDILTLRLESNEDVASRASCAVPVCVLFRAVRHLRHAHFFVVYCDLVPVGAVVACAVVVVVRAFLDDVHADLVVVLDLFRVADLRAFATLLALHFAVLDRLAAQVVGDLHLVSFAVETCARALLVLAVVDGLDAHVLVLGELVAVHALQAIPVAVVVVAVEYCGHA